MPATFNEIEHWSFAAVTNTSRISVNYDEQFAKSWPDLLGEVIYVASNTIGAVQVGKTDTRGYIHVTNIVEQVQDIIIRTRVRDEDHQHKMFVVCINDAIATNKVDISAEFMDYVVAVTNAREVVITSSAKNHPLQVADIRLVSDYRPPFIQTNTLSRTNVRMRHSWTFRNIPTGDYLWRVESLFGDGSQSAFSPYSAISLSPDSPRVPTGFCISIR